MPDFSVIVCTFDRPALLERMLESCAREAPPPGADWELLVIDNARDRPVNVHEFRRRLPLRLLREPIAGKSRALNTGVAAATGDLLLFADDDVELRPGWMRAFIEAAGAHPDAGWFGGRSIPRWDADAPDWVRGAIPPALRGYCCLYDLGDDHRSYGDADLLPIGASMAVRASTFAAIGGYREDLGPHGAARGVGDDTELIERALRRGIPGRYVPRAVVDHFVPAARLRTLAIVRYGVLKGRQQAAMSGVGLRPSRAGWRVIEQACRGALQGALGRRALAAVCALNVGLAIGSASARQRESVQRAGADRMSS